MADAPFPAGLVECISKFLATDHSPPGWDLYPEVFDIDLFFPLQRKAELRKMIQIARTIQPLTIMEIGTDKGGGLYHWCKCLQPSIMIACEIRGLPYAAAFEDHFSDTQFVWMPFSSQKVFANPSPLSSPIDILFIDGDKSQTAADFHAYLPFMSPNGIVFIHDILDSPGPKDAFHQLARRHPNNTKIIDLSNTQLALSREAQGIPPANAYEGWLRHWHGRSCGVGVIYLGTSVSHGPSNQVEMPLP